MTDSKNTPNPGATDPLDRLRAQWQQMQPDSGRLSDTNRRLSGLLAATQPSSTQARLCRRLKRFAYIGLAFPLLGWMLFAELEMPLWLCLAYVVYGVVMAALNWLLGAYVNKKVLVELPVAEAIRRASLIKLRQTRLRTAGIVLGTALIWALLADIFARGNDAMTVGALIGLLIGLSIGVPRLIVNARLARKLLRELHD